MTPQQAELHARIQALPLDAESASFPFTARLAGENGWSAAFARRAVAEYRRFLLLAATAGHPVTPSDEVDQVWHLHLLYTRSYWDDLCARTLGRPLHHVPTLGGPQEHAKFSDQYARTLESYRRVFGEEPPPDLWPPPAERFRPRRFQRVDVGAWWRLPRIRFGGRALAVLAAFAALLAVTGCAASAAGGPGARSGAGRALVAAGLLLAVTAVAAAASARRRARAPDLRDAPPLPELDPYEVAYLSGGAERAADAVIAGLVDRGAATHDPVVGMFANPLPEAEPAGAAPYRRPAPSPRGPHPFELAVHRALSQDRATRLRDVRAQALGLAPALAERLREAGLLVREGAAWRAAIRSGAAPLAALAVFVNLGIPPSASGPALILSVASVLALCVPIVRPLHRTRAGDAALASLEGRHGFLRARCPEPGCAESALGVALFGTAVLYGGSLGTLAVDLAEAALPLPGSSAGGGGGGCGGGGDGGGDAGGCGGGGCGGGGCGGGGCGGGGCGGGGCGGG